MRLVKCVHCREFIIHNKEEYRRHERKYHGYNTSQYEDHHHRPLSKEEFNAIVARGEEKFKHAIIQTDLVL
jgi:uncharacterized C2H2 Zn-finger protein